MAKPFYSPDTRQDLNGFAIIYTLTLPKEREFIYDDDVPSGIIHKFQYFVSGRLLRDKLFDRLMQLHDVSGGLIEIISIEKGK
jgi:hypothetical protein